MLDKFKQDVPIITDDFKAFASSWKSVSAESLTDGWVNYAESIKVTDKELLKFLSDVDSDKKNIKDIDDYMNSASQATSNFGSALKNIGANIGIMLALNLAIQGVAWAIGKVNDYINRLDIAKESLSETEGELDSVNSEIESVTARIKELNSLGTLSLTDKEELERLKEENAELEKRKKYLEMQKQEESEDVVQYAKEKMAYNYGRETSREDIDAYKKYMGNPEAYGSFYYEDDPLTIKIAQYEKFKEQRKQAIENDDWESVELLDKNLKNIEQSLIADRTELQGLRDDLSLTGESSEELDNVNNKLKFIDDLLLSPGQNLVNFIDNDIADESKDKLVKLAEEGKLTSDVLKKSFSDIDTYLTENGLTLEDLISILGVYKDELSDIPDDALKNTKSQMIDLINSMSDGFDVLDDVYADIFDKGSFDFTKLDSKKFSEAFKGLEGEYGEFIETVSSSPTDIKACQDAFDKLATAFIDNKGVLKNLTEENANVAISMLKNMGIANAEEIVMAQLAYNTNMVSTEKAFLAKYSHDVANATIDEVTEFLAENEVAETVRQSMAQLALSKISVNEQTIDTSKDIDNIIALANAAGASALALAKLEEAKAILNSESDGSIGWLRRYEAAERTIADIESGNFDWGFELLDPADFKVTNHESYKPKYIGGDQTADARTKAAEEAAKDAKDAYDDVFDFFERRVKVLEDAFANLEAGIENVIGADAKNTLLSAQLEILDEETRNYTDALKMYQEAAEGYLSKIPEAYREAAKNGEVSLIQFTGEDGEDVKDAIDDYQNWADKVAECTQKLQELQKQISELELSKFNNIIEDFTNQFDIHENSKNLIDTQIDFFEESGMVIGDSFYNAQIEQTKKQLDILSKEKIKLADQMASALASGNIKVGSEEWLEMVNSLHDVEENILECETNIEEFNNSISQLEVDKFDRINEHFDNLAYAINDSNDLINKQIDFHKESGELVGKSYYTTQIDQMNKQIDLLMREKETLTSQLEDSVRKGLIEIGSEEWLEMIKTIQEIDSSVFDCQISIEQLNNEILELDWSNFERVQTAIEEVSNELGNLVGLFDDYNEIEVSDGKGNWTDKAIATLGLHAQEYENAKLRVQQYSEAIKKLKEEYANGKYSTIEYTEKLTELTQGQWDAVNAAESAEDAIVSLNETRVNESIKTLNEELEAYRELIDAQIELIDETEKLKNKQEDLSEKSKTVADIEKQLAAMMYDNSAAAIAKRKLLEEELAEAKKDLADTEHNYSIESQKDALNKQYQDKEKSVKEETKQLEESLKDRETLIANSFETVKNNANTVANEINLIAQQHGVKVSNAIITPWANGENAIASYGEKLTTESSAFVGVLASVKDNIYLLQTNADNASIAISTMFGNRGDIVVSELERLYVSEGQLIEQSYALQGVLANTLSTKADGLMVDLTNSYIGIDNLNTVAGILQQSLINTLEGGYNVSGIVDALNSITNAANSAADAVRSIPTQSQPVQSPKEEQPVNKPSTSYTIDSNDNKTFTVGDLPKKKAEELFNKHYHKGFLVQAYAKGSKYIDEDQLAWTDEHGKREMIIRPSDGAILTRLEKGDSVVNSKLADNLFEWGKINPNNFMHGFNTSGVKIDVPVKENKSNITLHYDKMFEFNGDFNNSEQLLSQMKNVASQATTKILNDINRDYKIKH